MLAPLAVSVTAAPSQIAVVDELIATVGKALTVTMLAAATRLTHPLASVPETV